ncbi:MAG: hypothetical protein EBX52_11875 [Proteobacteria bacterium]|nr:hypothetical protein [Pseudomonadota bacterium]
MNDIAFTKQKYLDLVKTDGLQNAVNQLHHDLWALEQECFDTPAGYKPELWKKLNELRLFSRELWDLKLL